MNIEAARANAIKRQVRPWGGLNAINNNALKQIPRELFVPYKYRDLVFADIEIPLEVEVGGASKQVACMFSPKVEGRILDALNIKPTDTVLEIGTGSGYLTAVIAKLAKSITSIEINEPLYQKSKQKLTELGIDNATLVRGDASRTWQTKDFFDVVLVGASVPKISGRYFHLTKISGRIFVVEGLGTIMTAKLITRISETDWQSKNLFETKLITMQGLEQADNFSF